MSNNITIKDATGVSVTLHTIEDATSVHYNQSIPTDSAGNVATVVSGSQPVAATMGALVVVQRDAIPAGTNQIGKVSVGGNVSIGGAVSVHGGIITTIREVSIGGGTAQIGRVSVFVDQVPFNVSVNNTLPISVSVNNIVAVSVNGPLPAGTQHLGKVSVEGLSLGGGLVVSVAGAVSTQAVPVAGSDGTNVRRILTDVEGTTKVGGFTTNPEYAFTRPTDVAPYAIGDIVANSTVAGSLVPMSWGVSRLTGGGGSLMIRRARLMTPGDNRTTDRAYRLHIFNIASGLSATNGDNGVFAPTLVSNYCGYLDIPMFLSAATGAAGIGVPAGGSDINITLATGQVSISGFLESRVSILPASGAEYRTFLEVFPD